MFGRSGRAISEVGDASLRSVREAHYPANCRTLLVNVLTPFETRIALRRCRGFRRTTITEALIIFVVRRNAIFD